MQPFDRIHPPTHQRAYQNIVTIFALTMLLKGVDGPPLLCGLWGKIIPTHPCASWLIPPHTIECQYWHIDAGIMRATHNAGDAVLPALDTVERVVIPFARPRQHHRPVGLPLTKKSDAMPAHTIDLDPQKDILTFDEPGAYDFYVASVIVRPDRKNHFLGLVNSVFDFWCEQAPERVLRRIYGRVVSGDGEMMAKKLFFSPLWHISDSAYVLDMSRPNPSRLVQSFQYAVKSKIEEASLTAKLTAKEANNSDHIGTRANKESPSHEGTEQL